MLQIIFCSDPGLAGLCVSYQCFSVLALNTQTRACNALQEADTREGADSG